MIQVDRNGTKITISFDTVAVPGMLDQDIPALDIKVTDKYKFAQSFAKMAEAEDEDGDSPIHLMLDRIVFSMLEHGCAGVERTWKDS